MTDKKEVQRIQQKYLTEGAESLTKEEIKILKYVGLNEDKIVDSDDYTEPQVQSMKRREAKGEKLTDTEKKVLLGKKIDKQQEFLDAFIHGTNDVFRKHYDFKEDGVSFDIAIREPNVSENGRILALTNSYLEGMGKFVTDTWYGIYYTLSLIRICGEQVPLELKDDDKMYSPTYNWLLKIGNDFSEWESRFHS